LYKIHHLHPCIIIKSTHVIIITLDSQHTHGVPWKHRYSDKHFSTERIIILIQVTANPGKMKRRRNKFITKSAHNEMARHHAFLNCIMWSFLPYTVFLNRQWIQMECTEPNHTYMNNLNILSKRCRTINIILFIFALYASFSILLCKYRMLFYSVLWMTNSIFVNHISCGDACQCHTKWLHCYWNR